MKAFLSHSSKDKGFVRIVAEQLGKNQIEYDEFTFESGDKNCDAIFKALNNCGVFVFFISQNSLNSTWVKKEIKTMEEIVTNGNPNIFLPLLIDSSITFEDPLIPDWMRDYNLRYISKPTYCQQKIREAIRLFSWTIFPTIKQKDLMFVGRNQEIEMFEKRLYDYEEESILCCIVSGFNSIGRRKFLRHVMVKSSLCRESYEPRMITLDKRNSIEDFIIKMYGLGFSSIDRSSISNLSTKSLEDKIEIATQLIREQAEANEILFIEDKYCIVDRHGDVSKWFMSIVYAIRGEYSNIVICIVSLSNVHFKSISRNHAIYTIHIPELLPYERSAFFVNLLKVENIELGKDDIRMIDGIFSGYPEQVRYAVELIKTEGKDYVINNLHEIVEYNKSRIERVIKDYKDELTLKIMTLLANTEAMNILTLIEIIGDSDENIKRTLTILSSNSVLEYIGTTKEFIRLTDPVKDYIQRQNFKLESALKDNLMRHVEKSITDESLLERDSSDYIFSLKEALKNSKPIPDSLLLPSHYVNAMRELYNSEKRYTLVIDLGKRVLLNEKYLDSRIVDEIRYWLCLALARKRDNNFLSEVKFFSGSDYYFLLGFYYRMINKNGSAIDAYKKVLNERPTYNQARNELVQVYQNCEMYEDAYKLAEESYSIDKNNPYLIMSYFRCLLHVAPSENKDLLLELLESLYYSTHNKAKEMYATAHAQYVAYVEKNIPKAIEEAQRSIGSYPDSMYPYLTLLEISSRSSDISLIEAAITSVRNNFHEEQDAIYRKFPFLSCMCLSHAIKGNHGAAKSFFERCVKPNYSENVCNTLMDKINSYK